MVCFKYVFKNISALIKKMPGLAILIFLSELLTVLCLFFSYGLFYNTQETVGQLDEDYYVYWFHPSQTEKGTNCLKPKFKELTDYLGDNFNFANIYIDVELENNKNITVSTYLTNSNIKDLSRNEKPVFYLAKELAEIYRDGKISIDGKLYEAVLTKNSSQEDDQHPVMPIIFDLSGLPDDLFCTDFMLTVKNRPTVQSIDELNDKCMDLFGATCTDAPEPVKLMEVQINNSFYLYTFLIVVLVTLNLSVFFRYILSLRKRLIEVFIISGATRSDTLGIFIIEAIISMSAAYGLAYILYNEFILGNLSTIYPYFANYYNSKFYAVTFLMYLVVSVIILAVMYAPFIRRTMRGGRSE